MTTPSPSSITSDTADHTPGAPSIIARDVEVTYRVFTDGDRPTLRRLVSRRFTARPHRDVHAVRGVSFTAHVGEALALIGHNGSGKSTLLRTVAGLHPPTAGKVFASSSPVLLGVGAALHPELSGRRNVYLGATALGLSRAQIDAVFDDIVSFAGLEDVIDLPLKTYSSGMAARLRFSVSSAITPDILLIDEALSVGDEQFRKRSEARIKSLLDKAGTVVLVSHNLQTIREVCTRAIWLDHGVIKADGEVNAVVDAYAEDAAASA